MNRQHPLFGHFSFLDINLSLICKFYPPKPRNFRLNPSRIQIQFEIGWHWQAGWHLPFKTTAAPTTDSFDDSEARNGPSLNPIYITIDGRGLRNSESEVENTKTTSFSVSASICSVFFHGLMHWRGRCISWLLVPRRNGPWQTRKGGICISLSFQRMH